MYHNHIFRERNWDPNGPYDVKPGNGASHGMELDDNFEPLFVAVPDKVRTRLWNQAY